MSLHSLFDVQVATLDDWARVDATQEHQDDDAKDLYAAWMLSDERSAWLDAETKAEKASIAAAVRTAKAQTQEELAEALLVKIARKTTSLLLEQALLIYLRLTVLWPALCSGLETVTSSDALPLLRYRENQKASLPAWAFQAPSARVLDAMKEDQPIPCNLVLILVFVLLICPQAHKMQLLQCIQNKSPLDISQLDLKSAKEAGKCLGLYTFSFNNSSWYVGRVAQQYIHSRLNEHGNYGVNRIVRALLERHDWKKAAKKVLLDIPSEWKGMTVPVEWVTRIVEPVYIALVGSLEGENQMQFNLLDHVSWEAKASFATILKGWRFFVDWSRTDEEDGSRRLIPRASDLNKWDKLFGAAFDNTIAPSTIRAIVMGWHRTAITLHLPRPCKSVYMEPPAILFPPDLPAGLRPLSPKASAKVSQIVPAAKFNFKPPILQGTAKRKALIDQVAESRQLQGKKARKCESRR